MKGTKFTEVVKEYGRKLSDADLRYLLQRFHQRIGEDVAEAVEFLQKSSDIDSWLSTAKSANDFFDMTDTIDNILQGESRKRFNSYDSKDKYRLGT
jgi:hypothetical protein